MTDWQDIATAPKDQAILVYDPAGFDLDNRTWTWPEGSRLFVSPARWHEPNARTHDDAGWYSPCFWIDFGVYDDPSTDIDTVRLEPTHWMPLPSAPE